MLPPEGYRFKIASSGIWQLFAGEKILARGRDHFKPFEWHQVKMSLCDQVISVAVDGKEIVKLKDDTYGHGMVSIGSGFNYTEFDNFTVNPMR